jgi:hypothetical protein
MSLFSLNKPNLYRTQSTPILNRVRSDSPIIRKRLGSLQKINLCSYDEELETIPEFPNFNCNYNYDLAESESKSKSLPNIITPKNHDDAKRLIRSLESLK